MVDVHLITTGMIAVVPKKDGSSVRIIAPNLSAAHAAHHAHLLAESDLVSSTRPATQTGVHWKRHRAKLSAWHLRGEEVRILNPLVGSGLYLNPAYMFKMADIVEKPGDQSRLSPDLLTSTDPAVVSARMNLSVGELQSTFIHPTTQWRFVVGEDDQEVKPPKCLAEEVCVQFKIPEKPLILEIAKFGGGSFSIAIQPNVHGWIEVQLGNLPRRDVMIASRPDNPLNEEKDKHFHMYYDLAATLPFDDRIPQAYVKNPPVQLCTPPQENHPHRLTMGPNPAHDRLSTEEEDVVRVDRASFAAKVHGQLAGSTREKTDHMHDRMREAPVGGTGSHNCPPTLWDPDE